MADSLKDFGNKVRTIRKGLDLSQEDLAEKISRDVRSVVAIETGKRNPTFKTIEKICKALNVNSSELLPF